jgi:hypothetical protein
LAKRRLDLLMNLKDTNGQMKNQTKEAVAPKTGVAEFSKKNAAYTFPKYSYTVLMLKH